MKRHEEPAWRHACDESLRRYVVSRSRADGFDEATIERVVQWLPARRPGGAIRILRDRIEIELHGDVLGIFRRPYGCPHYEALPGSRRCRSYQDGGRCARPDQLMCVEWLRVNRRP